MAAPDWSAEHPLARWVLRAPRETDFFQLLQLVERRLQDHALLGGEDPRREAIRLNPALDLGFPAGDVHGTSWREAHDGVPGRLACTTTFLGLYGSDSPLPSHFTEALLSETEENQRAREFLDIFHHRVLSLLYRVWKKYRYYVTFTPDAADQISEVIRGFLGLATAGLAAQLGVPSVRMFRYVGLLAQRPRSTAGMTGLLRDYFGGLPFEIEPCVGRWLPIQRDDQNRLGRRKCQLGENFLLGERLFDRSGKFRVRIGPIGLDDYVSFLPTQRRAAELASVVRFYCGDPLEFDIRLVLRADEVPETRVGAHGFLGRLSWTSWLKSAPGQEQSVVFRAAPAAGHEAA